MWATYTIGDAEEVGLAQARKRAEALRTSIREGEDPGAVKQANRHRRGVTTVDQLTERWLASRETQSWRPRTRHTFESLLNRHILPHIGKLGITEVSRADIRTLMNDVAKDAPISANRSFEVTRLLYAWARSQDLVETSPCDGLKKIASEHARERRYTDEELRNIIAAVAGTEADDLGGLIIRTGTRSHETRAMQWAQIDLSRKLWTIPAEDAKSNREHVVPLSPGAWAILERRRADHGKGTFVFPAETGPCEVCERKGHIYHPHHRLFVRIAKDVGLGEPLQLHDLRRTVADRMVNEIGVAPFTVDVGVLGHALPGLVATYMPSGPPLRDVQSALAAWDARLDEILSGERRTADVVPMRRSSLR